MKAVENKASNLMKPKKVPFLTALLIGLDLAIINGVRGSHERSACLKAQPLSDWV